MKNVQMFGLGFQHVLLRGYLMIAVAIVFGSLGLWWLAAVLATAIAISFITAMRFGQQEHPGKAEKADSPVRLEPKASGRKVA